MCVLNYFRLPFLLVYSRETCHCNGFTIICGAFIKNDLAVGDTCSFNHKRSNNDNKKMSSSTAASNNNDHQSLHSEGLLSYSVQSSEHDTQEASNAPLIDTTQQSQQLQPQQHLDTQAMYHMPHSLTIDSFDVSFLL